MRSAQRDALETDALDGLFGALAADHEQFIEFPGFDDRAGEVGARKRVYDQCAGVGVIVPFARGVEFLADAFDKHVLRVVFRAALVVANPVQCGFAVGIDSGDPE